MNVSKNNSRWLEYFKRFYVIRSNMQTIGIYFLVYEKHKIF